MAYAGIAAELPGFTTARWRGNEPRQALRRAGNPPNLGQLCDSRYIVYDRLGWELRLVVKTQRLVPGAAPAGTAKSGGKRTGSYWFGREGKRPSL